MQLKLIDSPYIEDRTLLTNLFSRNLSYYQSSVFRTFIARGELGD